MATQNIFLIGPMGVGKTTIGRQLAQKMGAQFFDADQVIEEQTGVDIPWIFDLEGEAGFRKREENTIAKLSLLSGIVLATGGGAVLSAATRQNLKNHGLVVYLTAPIEARIQRTRHKKSRPLITDKDPYQVFHKLDTIREPLYLEIAEMTVDTSNQPLDVIINEIIQRAQATSG